MSRQIGKVDRQIRLEGTKKFLSDTKELADIFMKYVRHIQLKRN
jgi:hypothetical protein